MPATNILANLFVTLYNTESRRKGDCLIYPTSKIGIEVLKALQKDDEVCEASATGSPIAWGVGPRGVGARGLAEIG